MTPDDEFRPIPGHEGLYEISRDGRLFALERTILQEDSAGRKFLRTTKRHEKISHTNKRGYRSFNLHRDNKQTCRIANALVRAAWGDK